MTFDPIDQKEILHKISKRGLSLGHPMTYVEQTGSTNVDAMAAAREGAAHGSLFIADQQTQGHGRMGRPWHSRKGQSLLFSIILRPCIPIDRLPAITLAIGLAIADAIAHFVDNDSVGIKWPNDVLIRSRKVAGILIEGALTKAHCDHIVAGIGINIAQVKFDPSIEAKATSLAKETTDVPKRSELLLVCLQCIERRLQQFALGGLSEMMDDLQARDITKGKQVRVGERMGVAEGIAEDGRLQVMIEGQRLSVLAGEVQVVL